MANRKPKTNQDPRAVTLGKIIEYIRKDRSMTQGDLFNKCGVSVASISAYERGDRYPKSKFLQLLCDALEVNYTILINLVQEPVKAIGPEIKYNKETGKKEIINPAKEKIVKKIDPIECAKKIILNSERASNNQESINLLVNKFSLLSEEKQNEVFEFIETINN
ncbi:helix-turn-helix transcriptional regulator [Lentisphaerota bacterium WC36G]|nr:helix-turn-helix domain-containing protein [Lentisphaerae bacterium WC36]